MKPKITRRLVGLFVPRNGGATKRERRLFRLVGSEGRIKLGPAGEHGARHAAALREGGFVSFRRLISLFVSLFGFFLVLLVTANPSRDLTLERGNGLTQKRGPFPAIQLEKVVGGLTQPTTVTNAGDGSGRIFIVQETGEILIFINGSVLPTPFLDVSDLVSHDPEKG